MKAFWSVVVPTFACCVNRPAVRTSLSLLVGVCVCFAFEIVNRMERFNELVPRSRTLQQFVLRPHNVRVALLEADATADPANNSGHGVPPGSDEAHASLEATTPQSTDSTVAVNTVGPQGRAPSFPQHRKPGRRRANGTGRRRNLSPLKGGKPLRKPLSKLRGGNSTVSATF
eukprot:COSAG02_NODE_82_length_39723_cov_247.146650_5_plen_172_part_00